MEGVLDAAGVLLEGDRKVFLTLKEALAVFEDFGEDGRGRVDNCIDAYCRCAMTKRNWLRCCL